MSRHVFVVIIDTDDDADDPCIGDVLWSLPFNDWEERSGWRTHVTNLNADMVRVHKLQDVIAS